MHVVKHFKLRIHLEVKKFKFGGIVGLVFILWLLFATHVLSQSVIPDTIRLGIRTTVPPIGFVAGLDGNPVWSGFCHVFAQELEIELRQTNPNVTVKKREIVNSHKGEKYPRWGSLLTKNPEDRQDMQCGPNSRQAIENDQVIFSDVTFYETGIKFLLKKEISDEYLGEQSQKSFLDLLEIVRSRIRIGAIVGTTTLERLKSAGYRVSSYETRELLLDALDENEVQAFASDAIILRVLLENGANEGNPYKEQGYILFPQESGYLLGDTERYAIAISNEGENTGYSRELLSVTNRVLSQSKFTEDERNKLAQYESGQGDVTPFDSKNLFRNLLLGLIVFVFIMIVISLLRRQTFQTRKARNERNSNVMIAHLTINNISMSQDLTQAASQIQELIEQLQKQGAPINVAQERVAQELAIQAQNSPTMKDKLLKWGQSLADTTVSDVVKEVIKLAIRSVGVPLP